MNQHTVQLGPTVRMLLSCDGSTTVLLEALTGETLFVRVDTQGDTAPESLSDTIREALALDTDAPVLERRSCLVTSEHEVVSINHVVTDNIARRRMGNPDTTIPFGIQLRQQRIPQYRAQVSSGLAPWQGGDEPTLSAFKSYIIHDADGGRTYVHEHFNPRLVQLGDHASLRALPVGLVHEGMPIRLPR
ncbi:hypothetical protein ACFQZZ_00815 [Nocardia sp. GCM10030253]|uniref:hypothetical protein n=1 Tax=Nocardia sp. GCM10030253 TaxID=3273404 RepID=UPI003624F740